MAQEIKMSAAGLKGTLFHLFFCHRHNSIENSFPKLRLQFLLTGWIDSFSNYHKRTI